LSRRNAPAPKAEKLFLLALTEPSLHEGLTPASCYTTFAPAAWIVCSFDIETDEQDSIDVQLKAKTRQIRLFSLSTSVARTSWMWRPASLNTGFELR
jgi:hypothetical protein